MTNPIPTLEADAKAEFVQGEALLAPAVTSIKAMFASRANDVVLIAIVLLAVFVGHTI